MKRILVTVMGILALSMAANAAIVTTSWQGPVSTGLFQTNGANQVLAFNQFNPLLGSLLGVEFELTAYAEAGYEVVNDLAGADTTFQFQGLVTVILANPLGGNFVSALPTPSDIQRTVLDGDTYETLGFNGGVNPSVRALNAQVVNTGSTSNPAALALFIGNSTVNLNTSATINTQFNADNDVTSTVSSRASSSIRYRYTYDTGGPEVPEPASMALMGSALAGLGLLARRRMQK